MDPLQEALQMLDEAAAIIQELVAQVQSKGSQEDMSKKAEEIALKLGVSYDQASDMIKTAGDKGENIDSIVKAASFMSKNIGFGKVYTEENTIPKTGSKAQDNFLEKQAALMDELGLN
jgi:hypothetical protein